MEIHCILSHPKGAQLRFRSDCTNANVDLNLRWAHMSKGTHSDVAAHLINIPHCISYLYHYFIEIWSRHITFSALCDGKRAPAACTLTEGRVELRSGTVYTTSGGTCQSPNVCVNCNPGYYADGAYCRGIT